jgi:hypothetical protein
MHQLSLQFMHFHVTFLYLVFVQFFYAIIVISILYVIIFVLIACLSFFDGYYFIIILINQFGRFLSCYNFYYYIVLSFIVPNLSSFFFLQKTTNVSGISIVLQQIISTVLNRGLFILLSLSPISSMPTC